MNTQTHAVLLAQELNAKLIFGEPIQTGEIKDAAQTLSGVVKILITAEEKIKSLEDNLFNLTQTVQGQSDRIEELHNDLLRAEWAIRDLQ